MSTQWIRTAHSSRTRAIVGLTAAIGLLGATPALSAVDTARGDAPAVAPSVDAALTPALPANLAPLRVNTSLLGVHSWYQQMQDGYPVVDGLYAVHVDTAGELKGQTTVWDGRVSVGAVADTKATVTTEAAIASAVAHTGGTPRTYVPPSLWVVPGAEARLAWKVTTVTDGEVAESHVSYVDAQTGAVLSSVVESKSDAAAREFHAGDARTFDPNPVMKLQDQDITDQGDSNAAVPRKAYSNRKLKHLDRSHTLVGKWVRIMNDDITSSPDDQYFFRRADDDFEQVMGYYAMDTEQTYYQRLGFDDVNAEPQKIATNTFTADNSFYSPSQDMIETGTGGVDDAEDPEVVWHEGGHATQDAQVPGFGRGNEAGSIGEAFGDYIAVTLSQTFGKNTDVTPTSCVMDWDATSYSPGPIHCLRTTEADKMYPEDLEGEVHADGEIWSQALWDMNRSIGRNHATKAIIEAQFNFNPAVTMPEAARITVRTTRSLYGEADADKAQKAFEDRGIL